MTAPLRPKFTRRRVLLAGAALGFGVLGGSGCGYILYPERKGRGAGSLDVPVFIVDLLWLIPGLIPGVICLIVDFTTGCIYEDRSRRSSRASISEQAKDQLARGTIVIDGEVVASGEIGRESRAVLTWSKVVDEQILRDRGRLIFRRPDGAKAQAWLHELL